MCVCDVYDMTVFYTLLVVLLALQLQQMLPPSHDHKLAGYTAATAEGAGRQLAFNWHLDLILHFMIALKCPG